MMKVLTIREPWASLIVNGYKEYEFRSWKTNYRGKILIHTGLRLEKEVVDRFKKYNLNYVLGAIIGEAILTDCILVDDDFSESLRKINNKVYAKSNHDETYAWKLENVKMYDCPIYIKGRLGLWNYEGGDLMIHKMKLRNKPFMMIKSGKKKIEMRLYDEKRMLINVGDVIEFRNIDNDEIIKTLVVNLYKFNSFKELYDNFDKSMLGYDDNEEASYMDMEEYYSKDEQDKYGVLGIEIELC